MTYVAEATAEFVIPDLVANAIMVVVFVGLAVTLIAVL
jgi:hypothetical protein